MKAARLLASVIIAFIAVPQASVVSLDAWLDTTRAQYRIPALGAIVFRADTVLARGIIWPAGSVE